MTFEVHEGELCQQQDMPEGVKCNNNQEEDKCWSYWSDTDTLEQCKWQCQEHACVPLLHPHPPSPRPQRPIALSRLRVAGPGECFGYKPDDTGYFHKCRMLLPGKWAHKTARSSVGFSAYTPEHAWPPALNRPSSWLGSALVLLACMYGLGGALFGIARGR